jgi:hypothetical protein
MIDNRQVNVLMFNGYKLIGIVDLPAKLEMKLPITRENELVVLILPSFVHILHPSSLLAGLPHFSRSFPTNILTR